MYIAILIRIATIYIGHAVYRQVRMACHRHEEQIMLDWANGKGYHPAHR